MTLRERFCNNKRRLNRRVNRYMLLTAIALLFALNVFHLISLEDRQRLHGEFEKMRIQNELNRKMLDARARIQITLINTGKRRGAFTDDEIKILKENWDAAEYNEIEPNPFK